GQNTAVGMEALQNNNTGSGNTAVGRQALVRNTESGRYNTGVGLDALATNTTGYFNTAIGMGADVGLPTLKNATAIGSRAIVNEDNAIQLGNSEVTTITTSGAHTAAAYIKAGGTSSQFLMADGSVSTGGGSIIEVADEFSATV